MECPRCKIENPQENKFCNECGYDLRISVVQSMLAKAWEMELKGLYLEAGA